MTVKEYTTKRIDQIINPKNENLMYCKRDKDGFLPMISPMNSKLSSKSFKKERWMQ